MNAPERIPFDVQSLGDERGLRIDAVGISGLRYPVAENFESIHNHSAHARIQRD